MIILNKDNFKQEIFQEDIKTIVYFWGTSCEFSRMMTPYIDEVEEKYCDKYKFCKINVDKEPAISTMYGIDTTPTVLLLDCGDICARAIGVLMPKDIIDELGLESENTPEEEQEEQ